MDDPWVIEHGLSLTQDLEELGTVRRAGTTPRLSRTPARAGKARPPGADGAAILAELGLGGRAADLAQRRIVPERLPTREPAPAAAG